MVVPHYRNNLATAVILWSPHNRESNPLINPQTWVINPLQAANNISSSFGCQTRNVSSGTHYFLHKLVSLLNFPLWTSATIRIIVIQIYNLGAPFIVSLFSSFTEQGKGKELDPNLCPNHSSGLHTNIAELSRSSIRPKWVTMPCWVC